ncbi:Arf-GAP with SH3 domain, ANK repeat and PH domain-containing protein 1, partial [Melipona quadrifasciata]
KMPGLIAVSEFVEETREDYNSPTTSTFVSRMPQCRQTITSLEEYSTPAIDKPFLNPGGRSPFIHALSFLECLATFPGRLCSR